MKSTTAFDDQFSEEPDDTLARTGNTSKEQDMFAAGLEAGEANAKNNAAIRAASASVAPGDAQDERQAFEADYEAHFGFRPIWDDELLGRKGAYINSNQRNAFSMWQHGCARASAPAAGDARDAARYRRWRDAMIAKNAEFRQAVAAALPRDVGETRLPTAAEWDSAIDAALAAQAPQQGEA